MKGDNNFSLLVITVVMILGAAMVLNHYLMNNYSLEQQANVNVELSVSPVSLESTQPQFKTQKLLVNSFQCLGKVHCSEMNSCQEARFYLNNCPNVNIDGDLDGVPCEKQHCGSAY